VTDSSRHDADEEFIVFQISEFYVLELQVWLSRDERFMGYNCSGGGHSDIWASEIYSGVECCVGRRRNLLIASKMRGESSTWHAPKSSPCMDVPLTSQREVAVMYDAG